MRTDLENAQLMKQFLQIAQPLPVKYAYSKGVKTNESFVSFQVISNPTFKRGIGNRLISEKKSYQVVVQTKTAKENMIYSEMIKLATEGTNIQYISESPMTIPNVKSKCMNSIVLSLHSGIAVPKIFGNAAMVERFLQIVADRYGVAFQRAGIDIQDELTEALAVDLEDRTYDAEAIIQLKKEYLDQLVAEEASVSTPSNTRTTLQEAELVKRFLETVQPLRPKYGYSRGVKAAEAFVTYQEMGSANVRIGIGNQLVSEKTAFVITVQTKTAKENMLYSELIRLGTQESEIEYVSDSLRPDTLVADSWINTIIVNVYNNIHSRKVVYTADEVRQELQIIADRYIFVTSIYRETLAASFIDTLVVPELEDKLYSYEEFLALKQRYFDKLLWATTEY